MARQTGGRLRAAIFLFVSLVSAVVASLVIYTVITNLQQELDQATIPEEKIEVVVAANELLQGKTITIEDLTIIELPPSFVPDAIYTDPDDVVGRVPQERILANEFIREERLADPEAGLGLNAIIPRGMRAISINITDGSAVSGFLNPGNYVDMLVTVQPSDQATAKRRDAQMESDRTVTLLQAVRVLAVNSRGGGAEAQKKAAPSVTLAVTPDQAERIAHAFSEGAVTLTLRNDIDVTQIETHGDDVEQLIGGSDQQRVPVTDWKKKTKRRGDGSLMIIRGNQVNRDGR